MDEIERFSSEVRANVDRLLGDADMQALSRAWLLEITRRRYTYNFSWLGRPVIQLPQDLLAVQELIWQVRPDLIVETGIAHGGSLIHSASLLEILGGDGLVVGVDVDIRSHNRREIERHPLARRITLIEGSSIDEAVAAAVRQHARGRRAVMVILDSNHTHDHVLKELALYAPLVTRGSYLVVLRHADRGPAGGAVRGAALGQGQQSQDRGVGILEDHRPLRDRRAHPRQAAAHVRARRLSAVHR